MSVKAAAARVRALAAAHYSDFVFVDTFHPGDDFGQPHRVHINGTVVIRLRRLDPFTHPAHCMAAGGRQGILTVALLSADHHAGSSIAVHSLDNSVFQRVWPPVVAVKAHDCGKWAGTHRLCEISANVCVVHALIAKLVKFNTAGGVINGGESVFHWYACELTLGVVPEAVKIRLPCERGKVCPKFLQRHVVWLCYCHVKSSFLFIRLAAELSSLLCIIIAF